MVRARSRGHAAILRPAARRLLGGRPEAHLGPWLRLELATDDELRAFGAPLRFRVGPHGDGRRDHERDELPLSTGSASNVAAELGRTKTLAQHFRPHWPHQPREWRRLF